MKSAFISLTLALVFVAPARAASEEISDGRRLVNALLQGITEGSRLPRQSPQELKKARILMQAKERALSDLPLTGFMNLYQVTNSAGHRNVTGGANKGPELAKRRRIERMIFAYGGNSSMFPKYAYYDNGLPFDTQFNYGKLFYEFEDSVLPRVTYVRGDTLDDAKSLIRPLALALQKGDFEGKVNYYEAEIWGDLWLRDVKYVYVPETIM